MELNQNFKMLDITGARHVHIQIRADSQVVWVNVNEKCALRICRIDSDGTIVIEDECPKIGAKHGR